MKLQKKADELRQKIFDTIYGAGGGHFGGSLSVVEILTALFYGGMSFDASKMEDPKRDRLVLSKGHAGPALYVTLADIGCFPEEKLQELDQNGGSLPKHVDRLKVPGVELSTGPLGQGFSVATGMALGLKDQFPETRVFAILGDGECDEGQIWEAAMAAAHYKLSHFMAIVDVNGGQVDGATKDVMDLGDLAAKWKAFGWRVAETDGNDADGLLQVIQTLKNEEDDRPAVILAKTVKGKGVPFMENVYSWHSGKINAEQYKEGAENLRKVMEV